MTLQCVILAGGMGTRMQAHAGGGPKSLIPILGKPFLHYQLENLARQSIQDIVICTGFGSEQIQQVAQKGVAWGVSIRYVEEGSPLRGTGGALRLALDRGVLKPRFLVLYGDSYLPISIPPIWKHAEQEKAEALMTVMRNAGQWERSNASFDGAHVTRYDKKHPDASMKYVDYGISVLTSILIQKEIPADNTYDLADLFHSLSVQERLAGIEVRERFYEIGSPQGLSDFEAFLKNRKDP